MNQTKLEYLVGGFVLLGLADMSTRLVLLQRREG